MEDREIITLTDEDGIDIDYVIIESVEYNDNVYVAVVEATHVDDPECEFMILRVDDDEEDEDEKVFNTITDEDEFNEVLEAIEAKLDDEYDFDTDTDSDEI